MTGNKDMLDHILYDTAGQLTNEMDFAAGWRQVQAAHRRKRLRKGMLRFGPIAAALVVGLSVGALWRQSGQTQPTPQDTSPAIDSQGGILTEPSILPEQVPDVPYVVIDPPKTDGYGVEEEWFGDVATFETLPRTSDLRQLFPCWLPEYFTELRYDTGGNRWTVSGYENANDAYLSIETLEEPLEEAKYQALEFGQGIPLFQRVDAMVEEPLFIDWMIRLEGERYLFIHSEFVPLSDTLRIIENLGSYGENDLPVG